MATACTKHTHTPTISWGRNGCKKRGYKAWTHNGFLRIFAIGLPRTHRQITCLWPQHEPQKSYIPLFCLEYFFSFLRPQGLTGDREVYAKVDLWVQCPQTYPDTVPEIELQNAKGLSNENINLLKSRLEELAKERCGEVSWWGLLYYSIMRC
uniref:RWD domain-containing protein n=1 Tax=Podarcis muralis TaxID=64176 RepID=A0A670JYG3_PODMU